MDVLGFAAEVMLSNLPQQTYLISMHVAMFTSRFENGFG